MKRLFDIVFSAFVLLVLAPLLFVVAVTIYANDRGPVIFRQPRVGLLGSQFLILKFRSMVTNADKIGGFSTATNDPRITRIGLFIRKTSIDELPQFFNVLLGDMSIVGPRPDVPAQKKLYTEAEWAKRTSVKPGITGLAQATVRSEATPAERKRLDLEYIDHQSLLFDLQIIFMTVKQVLFRGGN